MNKHSPFQSLHSAGVHGGKTGHIRKRSTLFQFTVIGEGFDCFVVFNFILKAY